MQTLRFSHDPTRLRQAVGEALLEACSGFDEFCHAHRVTSMLVLGEHIRSQVFESALGTGEVGLVVPENFGHAAFAHGRDASSSHDPREVGRLVESQRQGFSALLV